MSKLSILTLLFFINVQLTFSQLSNTELIVKQGVDLYKEGKTNEAIQKYNEALNIDPKSDIANYEMSYALFHTGKYSEAIPYIDAVIKYSKRLNDHAYILKGSIYNTIEKPVESISILKKGIKKNPNTALLYFNIALPYLKLNNLKEAEENLKMSINLNPTHSSSHLLLSTIQNDKGLRFKYLITASYFFLLEQKTKRATSNFKRFKSKLLPQAKLENNTININIHQNESDDIFKSESFMFYTRQALYAAKDSSSNKSAFENYQDQLNLLFSCVSTATISSSEWWNFYIDFWKKVNLSEHKNTVSYIIAASSEDPEVDKWIEENEEALKSFFEWFDKYLENRK